MTDFKLQAEVILLFKLLTKFHIVPIWYVNLCDNYIRCMGGIVIDYYRFALNVMFVLPYSEPYIVDMHRGYRGLNANFCHITGNI